MWYRIPPSTYDTTEQVFLSDIRDCLGQCFVKGFVGKFLEVEFGDLGSDGFDKVFLLDGVDIKICLFEILDIVILALKFFIKQTANSDAQTILCNC